MWSVTGSVINGALRKNYIYSNQAKNDIKYEIKELNHNVKCRKEKILLLGIFQLNYIYIV